MKKKYLLPFVFLFIGVFSYYLADLACALLLDKIDCWEYLALVCKAWDTLEYKIAHVAFSYLFYYVGYYGFSGSIFYLIEDRIMGKYKLTGLFFNIFGLVTSFVVGIFVAYIFGNIFNISTLFEFTYKLFN